MKKSNLNNKGFTLVEMCVAIAIFSIIAATVVFSLIKWQAYYNYRKQEEYARTIFLSARQKMSMLKADNVLEEFFEDTMLTDPLTGKKNYSCRFADNSSLYPAAEYNQPVCYANCSKGDYDKYMSGNYAGMRGKEAKKLFELIKDYVYEKTLLNNCVAIEYAPESGQVFAVFYSDKADCFVYDGGNARNINISKRSGMEIFDEEIGYYSYKN